MYIYFHSFLWSYLPRVPTIVCVYIYSGAKKYLVSHQLCKFSLKKMREACNFHHMYTSTMRDKIRKKNPENHIVGFFKNLFANYGGK